MFGLSTNDVELLKESAPMYEQITHEKCNVKESGGMEEWAKSNKVAEESTSCEWYHSTWQYLRLLNMVAVPNWYEFYVEEICKVLSKYDKPKVFISACADYGMLAKLHEAMIVAKKEADIIIYDICHSPLDSCKWYAQKYNIDISCKTGNIISDEIPEAPFDLIITDEFFTVLKDEDKPQITNKWHSLLKEGGTVITTAMLGEPTTQERRDYFFEKAVRLLNENNEMMFPFIKTQGQKEVLINRFKVFAQLHTRHMMKNEDMVNDLFKNFKNMRYTKTVTPGECVNPTVSCQIIAQK